MRKKTLDKAILTVTCLGAVFGWVTCTRGAAAEGRDPNAVGPTSVTARQTPLEELIRNDSELPTTGLVSRFLVAMVFVGVLAGAAYFLSKRVTPKLGRTQGKELAVVESIGLGNRRAIHLIQVGPGRRILVGSTADRISYLADVSPQGPIEEEA